MINSSKVKISHPNTELTITQQGMSIGLGVQRTFIASKIPYNAVRPTPVSVNPTTLYVASWLQIDVQVIWVHTTRDVIQVRLDGPGTVPVIPGYVYG